MDGPHVISSLLSALSSEGNLVTGFPLEIDGRFGEEAKFKQTRY